MSLVCERIRLNLCLICVKFGLNKENSTKIYTVLFIMMELNILKIMNHSRCKMHHENSMPDIFFQVIPF